MSSALVRYLELVEELVSRRAAQGKLSDDEEERYAVGLNDCRAEMTNEETVALKFYTGGRHDLDDVADAVRSRSVDLKLLREIIRKHLGVYAIKKFNEFGGRRGWERS
jgi:flagellar hook-basal body complex protein FliE